MSSRAASAMGSSRGDGFEKAGGKAAGVSGGGVSHRSHVSGAGAHQSHVSGAGAHRTQAPGGKSNHLALSVLAALGAICFSVKITGSLGLSFGLGVLAGGAVFIVTRKPSSGGRPGASQGSRSHASNGKKKNDGRLDHVHIYVLLDSSGSMSHVEDGVIQGFDNFVQDTKAHLRGQRIPAYFTLVQFSTENPFKVSIEKKKIKDLQPGFLTKSDPVNNVVGTFAPSGGTPLYDAFGQLIEHAAAQKSSTEAVNMFVFSDGKENDSTTFTEGRLKDLIAEKNQENGWRFGFLGANQDAKAFADKFGLGADAAQNLTYDADGFKTGWQTMTQSVAESISQPNNIDGAFKKHNNTYESQGAYGKRGAGSLSNNLGSIPSSSRY